jgi:hypothetical protein
MGQQTGVINRSSLFSFIYIVAQPTMLLTAGATMAVSTAKAVLSFSKLNRYSVQRSRGYFGCRKLPRYGPTLSASHAPYSNASITYQSKWNVT